MIVNITRDAVRLDESDDMKRLHATADRSVDIDRTLRSHDAGAADTKHALISIRWIRDEAGELSESADWDIRFESMLSYARSKGWVIERQFLQAHIERT